MASASAAVIALAFAIQSFFRDETALVRDLFWPGSFSPYITFSLVFIGVVPALLGYYHLGRVGLMLNIGAGFALVWAMSVCLIFCFVVVGRYFGSLALSTVLYAGCVTLAYLGLAGLHFRAARSLSVRDAQRKLRLLATGGVSS